MEELIKLDAYPIRGLVGRLLQDKTTRKNILFASDSYAGYGAGYRDDSQMTEGVLLGFDSCDIQPRVYKAASEQTERTRKRAEVFTPAWIVNQMNNHCDAEWFGRTDVFNHQEGQEWTVSTEPVTFPEGKDWKQYVDSRRLEITCGEAPYIVSRYDTATGEIIPIERRIGILDRKLRVVFDNGEVRLFDVAPLIKGSWFGELQDDEYFSQVRISGLSVQWPDGQDICPDDLYYLSVPI